MKRPPAGARASRPSASHSRAACTRHTLVHLQHRATSNARCPTVRWSSMPSEAHVVAQFRGHHCGRADSQHGKARAVRSFGPSSPRRMRIPCLDSPRAAYIWQVSMEPSKASTQKENGKLTANRSKGGRCAQNARRNVQYLPGTCVCICRPFSATPGLTDAGMPQSMEDGRECTVVHSLCRFVV